MKTLPTFKQGTASLKSCTVADIKLLFSEPAVAVYSFSVFLRAVSQDFHVGRGAVSFAFTIHNLCAAAISPFVGRLIDRFGIRRVVLPSAILVGLVIISAKWIGSSVSQYYLFYLALGCIGLGAGVVPYSAVISPWFDRHRSLALGLMSFGSGTAAMLYPPVAQRLIALYGWRSAYAIFGTAIPFVVLWLFLKEGTLAMFAVTSSHTSNRKLQCAITSSS
jgi:MFS family permease